MNVEGGGGGGGGGSGSAFANFDRFVAGEISAGEGAGGDVGTTYGSTEGAGSR